MRYIVGRLRTDQTAPPPTMLATHGVKTLLL